MINDTQKQPTYVKINALAAKLTIPFMDLSALVTFALMLFITLDVFLRTVFNSPIAGSIEIAELMMVVLCFSSFIYTQTHGKHLGIDILTSRVTAATRYKFSIFTNVLGGVYLGILSWQMVVTAIKFFTRDDVTGISEIATWPFMAFAALMMIVITLLVFLDAYIAIEEGKKEKNSLLSALFIVALALIASYIPFHFAATSLGMSRVSLGGLSFLYLMALAILGMPIGYAMLVAGVQVLLLIMPKPIIALSLIGASPFYATGAILMVVVPMFVLMGELAIFGNISAALFNACKVWVGKTPGGLAISSVGGCAGFAAVCGDAWVTALTMASVAMPEMEKQKYNKAFGAACLCIGGPLGILIPPSYGFIIYAIVTGESVGKLFMAGLVPGILLTLILCLIIYVRAKRNPSLAPEGSSYTMKEKLKASVGVIPMLSLFTLIIGGILSGIFTPNEGGAVASFACFLYILYLGQLNMPRLREALYKTCDITSKAFMIFVGVGVLGYALSASHFPMAVSDYILSLKLGKYALLVAIILMFTLLGCMMNATPMLLLALPAIFPTVVAYGFDTVWFGVICVIMMELSAVTPPVGLVVYALSTVVKDVSVAAIFYQLIPLYLGIFVLLALVIAFPEIALFLPNLLFS